MDTIKWGGSTLRGCSAHLLAEQLLPVLAAVLDQSLLDLIVRRVAEGGVLLPPVPRDDGLQRAVGAPPAGIVIALGADGVAGALHVVEVLVLAWRGWRRG